MGRFLCHYVDAGGPRRDFFIVLPPLPSASRRSSAVPPIDRDGNGGCRGIHREYPALKSRKVPSMPSRNGTSDLSLRVRNLLCKAKIIAKEYYRLTGRPLGITGEVAECEAARLLGITLAVVRQTGYDAI